MSIPQIMIQTDGDIIPEIIKIKDINGNIGFAHHARNDKYELKIGNICYVFKAMFIDKNGNRMLENYQHSGELKIPLTT